MANKKQAPQRTSTTPRPPRRAPDPRPVLISSWNGLPATARAAERYGAGTPLLDAIVAGTSLVEDDPEEYSVGFGGLPNEDCVVELDAAVMDGPRHRAAGVAGLRGFRHASAVALEVLARTDHSLLVGAGADRFARLMGFPEEDLLTPAARRAWLEWKADLSERDAWLSARDRATDFGTALWAGKNPSNSSGGSRGAGLPAPPQKSRAGLEAPHPEEKAKATGKRKKPEFAPHEQKLDSRAAAKVPFTYGTIHTSGLDRDGNLYAVTSTSGLSYKLAGRVGDSPIAGAGLYVDNEVGAAGATGRGEAVMQSCGAFAVVHWMSTGLTPEEACLRVLDRIAARTREKRLLDAKGRPNFNVTLYALRKDGATGSASMHRGYEHVVQRGPRGERRACAFLFE